MQKQKRARLEDNVEVTPNQSPRNKIEDPVQLITLQEIEEDKKLIENRDILEEGLNEKVREK